MVRGLLQGERVITWLEGYYKVRGLYTRTVKNAHSVLDYTQEQFNMHTQF